MNPMFQAAIGSVIRSGLMFLAGYLVQRGIWSDAEAGIYVGAAAIGATGLLWSVYQKYVARSKLVTALATPGVMSEATLERVIQTEDKRPPVTMQSDTTPYPVGTTNPRLSTPIGVTQQHVDEARAAVGAVKSALDAKAYRPPPPPLPPPPDVED